MNFGLQIEVLPLMRCTGTGSQVQEGYSTTAHDLSSNIGVQRNT